MTPGLNGVMVYLPYEVLPYEVLPYEVLPYEVFAETI